jgi:hypothetical protein
MRRTIRKNPKRGVLKNPSEIVVAKFIRKHATCKVTYEDEDIPYTYTVRRNYRPDFIAHLKDGTKRYIEVKGYLRPEDRTKMRAAKACNPDLDIRILFLKNNPLKPTKMRYSDWAEKYGFPYAIGTTPPKEWLS